MRWEKLKLLFCPENNYPWMATHAANPVAYVDDKSSVVRIFFSCRNSKNMSSIAFADVDFEDNFRVVRIADAPVLSPGTPGFFDDDGVSMSWILQVNNQFYLYYLGWNLRVRVPWLNTIGLAIGDAIDGPFKKYSSVPILDRSTEDPFTVSYPCVIFDNNIYRMWYGSNLCWGEAQHEMAHVIKYAESIDGIHWNRTNDVHIPFIHDGEYAISKPCVLRFSDGYKMWYSFRASELSDKYRIGMAISNDGYTWLRKDDESGIDVSNEGWDSMSIEYPNVFKYRDDLYMLYNGNEYGKTGFGIARLVKN